MLVELYFFFCQTIPPSLNIKLWLFVTDCIVLCVQQTGTTGADHWTEAEWVESLHGGSGIRRHRRSWCSLVNKVRAWVCVLPGSYYNSIWTFKVSAEKRFFLPWLSFSSAKLPTSGVQLREQSALQRVTTAKLNMKLKKHSLNLLSGANS